MEKIIIHVIIHNDILMLMPQVDKKQTKKQILPPNIFLGKKPFVYWPDAV